MDIFATLTVTRIIILFTLFCVFLHMILLTFLQISALCSIYCYFPRIRHFHLINQANYRISCETNTSWRKCALRTFEDLYTNYSVTKTPSSRLSVTNGNFSLRSSCREVWLSRLCKTNSVYRLIYRSKNRPLQTDSQRSGSYRSVEHPDWVVRSIINASLSRSIPCMFGIEPIA